MIIKIILEYKCYPIWVYDDYGDFIKNNFPSELINDKKLYDKFIELQVAYDNLFIDDGVEFTYRGFDNENKRENYICSMKKAIEELEFKLGKKHSVDVKLNTYNL